MGDNGSEYSNELDSTVTHLPRGLPACREPQNGAAGRVPGGNSGGPYEVRLPAEEREELVQTLEALFQLDGMVIGIEPDAAVPLPASAGPAANGMPTGADGQEEEEDLSELLVPVTAVSAAKSRLRGQLTKDAAIGQIQQALEQGVLATAARLLKKRINNVHNRISVLRQAASDWSAAIETMVGSKCVARKRAGRRGFTGSLTLPGGHGRLLEAADDHVVELQSLADLVEERLRELKGQMSQAATSSTAGQSAPPSEVRVECRGGRRTRDLPYERIKIKPPQFNGEPVKWRVFWSHFSATVDSDEYLTPAQKLTYLVSSCTGPAHDMISAYELIDINYAKAVKVLQDRYGNTRVVLRALHDQYERMKPMSGTGAKEMRRFYDESEQLLNQLEAHGVDMDSYSIHRTYIAKIPMPVMLSAGSLVRVDLTEAPLAVLRNSIRELLLMTEKATGNYESERTPVKRDTGNHGKGRRTTPPRSKHRPLAAAVGEPTSAFTAGVSNGSAKSTTPGGWAGKKKECRCCGKGHATGTCRTYPTRTRRLARLRELSRCVICTGSHLVKDCTQKEIECFKCHKKGHAVALCPAEEADGEGVTTSVVGVKSATVHVASVNVESAAPHIPLPARLMTVFAYVRCPYTDRRERVQVFLDTGAQVSFVRKDLVERLGLPTMPDYVLPVTAFGEDKPRPYATRQATLELELLDGTHYRMRATAMENFGADGVKDTLEDADIAELVKLCPQLLADPVAVGGALTDPAVLVGVDHYMRLMGERRVTVLPSGKQLLETLLGPMVCGKRLAADEGYVGNMDGQLEPASPTASRNRRPSKPAVAAAAIVGSVRIGAEPPVDDESTVVVCSVRATARHQPEDVDQFWRMDTIGISGDVELTDDDRAIQQFNENIKFNGSRYVTAWPKRSSISTLPTNRELCFKRLCAQANKFKSQGELLLAADEIIRKQLADGIIEPVPVGEPAGQVHYLPHQLVITPSKETTKIRLVYDASARSRGQQSLNDCLLRGPVILPDLAGTLIRLQLFSVGLTADVEKAFLQIELHTPDRDLTRFFWYKDASNATVQGNVEEFRFCRVPFGVISSPALLALVLQHLLKRQQHVHAALVAKSFYVDDMIASVADVATAKELKQFAVDALASASMRLRGWVSNVPDMCDEPVKNTTVLGMRWDLEHDQLQLKPPAPLITKTKRGFLQLTCSLFDPLGWVSPVSLVFRMHTQKFWERKLDWDVPAPDDLGIDWEGIRADLDKLSTVKMHRHCGLQAGGKVELHVFGDASGYAYAACAYLVVRSESAAQSRLVFAKSRVAAIDKKNTIPRLELTAMLIACRMSKFLCEQVAVAGVHFARVYVWSDSATCMHWLTTNKNVESWVDRRLREIHQLQRQFDINIRHVAGIENPADVGSRGCTADELLDHALWWAGPAWLVQDEADWPQPCMPAVSTADVDVARESKPAQVITMSQAATGVAASRPPPEKNLNYLTIDLKRYLRVSSLLRNTVYAGRCVAAFLRRLDRVPAPDQWTVKHFFDKLRRLPAREDRPANDKRHWRLKVATMRAATATEMQAAAAYWARIVQQEAYSDVLKALRLKRKHKLIDAWGLRLDDMGLIRVAGRFYRAEGPPSRTLPILLPPNHRYTRLMFIQAHEDNEHCGSRQALAAVQQAYFVHRGRREAHEAVQSCITCRRIDGPPYANPPLGPYPVERISIRKPFEYTGLDYAGPFNIRTGTDTCKTYICLFTCFTTRAVHLEVVQDLSAQAFLQAFSRFCARRGVPTQMYSDNATQFAAAGRALNEAWHTNTQDPTVVSYCAEKAIEWQYTVPHAPWQGGLYERLIGTFKTALRKAIGLRHIDYVEMTTLCAEIEAVINSRPIVYVGDKAEGGRHLLRPCDFLTWGRPTGSALAPQKNTPRRWGESTAQALINLHSQQLKLLDKFWATWCDEYLPILRERRHAATRQQGDLTQKIKAGDAVLVYKPNMKRAHWPWGRVVQLNVGDDGYTRSALVELPNGIQCERAAKHLHPLETCPFGPRDTPVLQPQPRPRRNVGANSAPPANGSGAASARVATVRLLDITHAQHAEGAAGRIHAMTLDAALPKLKQVPSAVPSSPSNGGECVELPFGELPAGSHGGKLPVAGEQSLAATGHEVDHIAKGSVRAAARRQSRGPLHFSTLLLLCCLFAPGVRSVADRTFQLCSPAHHGHAISIPDKVNCHLPHAKDVRQVEIEMWVLREEPQRAEAIRCYLTQHVIVTTEDFFTTKAIVGEKITYHAVSAAACRQAVELNEWEGVKLVEMGGGMYSTNRTLIVKYYWFSTHVNSVVNFVLQRGEVATINGNHVTSNLQDVSACRALAGQCTDQGRAVVVWNATAFDVDCGYQYHGRYDATATHSAIVVTELHAAYTFNDTHRPPHSRCVPDDARYADQGAVFIRTLDDHADHKPLQLQFVSNTNAKLQYLSNSLQTISEEQFRALWHQLCSVKQAHINMVWQLLRIDPTLGARALLGRNDIQAAFAGDVLMFSECSTIKPAKIYLSQTINATCYKYLPVRLTHEGPLYFAVPGSRDLVQESPVVSCLNALPYVYKNGEGWQTEHGSVSVTELPYELAWKGSWRSFTFADAGLPTRGQQAATLAEWSVHAAKLNRLERQLDQLVDYTAELALDPDALKGKIAGIGAGIGHVIEGEAHAISDWVSGLGSAGGSFLGNFIKGPVQLVINVVLTVLGILGLLYACAQWYAYRRSVGKPFVPGWVARAWKRLLARKTNKTGGILRTTRTGRLQRMASRRVSMAPGAVRTDRSYSEDGCSGSPSPITPLRTVPRTRPVSVRSTLSLFSKAILGTGAARPKDSSDDGQFEEAKHVDLDIEAKAARYVRDA